MVRIFWACVLPVRDDQQTIIIIVIIIIIVTRPLQRLGQLDRLLQPGVQAVVGLVAEAAVRQGNGLHVHDARGGELKWLQWLLVALVEGNITLVKPMLDRKVVVVAVVIVYNYIIVVDCVLVDSKCFNHLRIIILEEGIY
jgi:hypothetical protein